ncbi:hypothetical protein HUT06_41530 [Actinomadura sp. NAK00032]|uniref:hypothetical protein n=1 Tax=Actinomadura sp. NAK00032 TaxID=2742128 RepID=UPI0015924C68|nr:hypothetical protein [Actinomadura sp. NAK00032]QKW39717.1 hypothetical protein HUT06_41530 [Actinomadura sp. NAK00032]
MKTCRIFGHDFRFTADGATMRWTCARGCGAGGAKEYGTASEAQRYARAFDKKDTDDMGRRAPLVGLFPLRMAHAMRKRVQR